MTSTGSSAQILDPSALRIPPAARNSEKRKQSNLNLKIVKPLPDDWARIHPSEAFRWEGFWAYEKDKQYYVVSHATYLQLEEQVQRVFAEHDFYTAAILNGDSVVWPVKHSDTDWYRSMREATLAAFDGWVQVQSNSRTTQYDVRTPKAGYATPDWSALSTDEDACKLFT